MTAGQRNRVWKHATLPNLTCHQVVRRALVGRRKVDRSTGDGYVATLAHTSAPYYRSSPPEHVRRDRRRVSYVHKVERLLTVWDNGEYLTLVAKAKCGSTTMSARVLESYEEGTALCRQCFCECA